MQRASADPPSEAQWLLAVYCSFPELQDALVAAPKAFVVQRGTTLMRLDHKMQAWLPATSLNLKDKGEAGSHAVSPPPVRALCTAAGAPVYPSGLPAAPFSSEPAAPSQALPLQQHPATPAPQQLQSAPQAHARWI